MGYVIIGVCIILIVIGVVFYLKNKVYLINSEDIISTSESDRLNEIETKYEVAIQIEMIPVEAIPDKNELIEIKDKKLLSRINNLLPEMAKARTAVQNTVQTAKSNGEVLYRAILPAGTKLTDSKSMEGAVRGIYRGTNSIKGHANFVAVEVEKSTKTLYNTAAAAMGVASMVVGQYYMTQINDELGKINDGISQINDFLNYEYKSNIHSLLVHVKKIADFQIEILENDEQRLLNINHLKDLEKKCTQLLAQANFTLEGYAKKNDLNYEGYEKALKTVQSWFMYQNLLMDILCRISDLEYALNLGGASREMCSVVLTHYSEQVQKIQSEVSFWHEETAKRLGIELDESRRKRSGVDGVIYFIPGLFNDDFNYREMNEETEEMIAKQKIGYNNKLKSDSSELYLDDVQLISKDGKIYYLPMNKVV